MMLKLDKLFLIQCVLQIKKNLVKDFTDEMKNSFYFKRHYVLSSFPEKYSDKDARQASLICIKHFLSMEKAPATELDFCLKKYLSSVEEEKSSVIKEDLLPIYRKLSFLIFEKPELKNFTTKVGLILMSCGEEIK